MVREPIYAALFAKLSAASKFATASRRLVHWADVSPADMPALFMSQKSERVDTVPAQPSVWTLSVLVYIYVHVSNSDAAPGQLLNPLLDSVVASIAPDYSGKQTLGGLVQHCWVEGEIRTDEGTLGDLAVAVVPVVLKFA